MRPPGPRGHLIFGSLPELTADWLGYMAECERTYGSVVRLRMPWPLGEIVLVTDPLLIERVLIDDAANFRKSILQRTFTPLIGESSVVIAEGDAWRRKRRLLQPAFHRKALERYAEDMLACCEIMAAAWQHGGERDIYADAIEFTIQIAARTLFGARFEHEFSRVLPLVAAAYAAFDDYMNSRVPLPLSFPTPAGLRIRRVARALEQIIYDYIEERRRNGDERHDLLAMLLSARDEDGSRLSEREIRDEAITAFCAATETSAVTLSWALYLLAKHPEIAQQARTEVEEVVGGERLSLHHLSALKFTQKVLKETMRMYPPGWRNTREARRDVNLDGFLIPKGAQVLANVYLVQRHAKYFPDPERFLPSRWTGELERALPRCAYFPFGRGQRMCVGGDFATMELTFALATILPRFRCELTEHIPEPKASITLRPQDGIRLRVVGHA